MSLLFGLTQARHFVPQVLTGRARVEAEDAQRVLLAALNGLAGLMLLEGDVQLAVATYRQVRHAQPGYCMHPYEELMQVLLLAGVQKYW